MEEAPRGKKCQFQAIYSSSEEPGFTADSLNSHSLSSQGWQTIKFCDYPQELGLRLVEDDPISSENVEEADLAVHKVTKTLTQLQLLSHESKISSRIELYVGNGDNYHEATFTRLGFLALDGNERTEHRARELKTVFIDQKNTQYVRLIIHRPHKNNINLFSQVGIVAINLLGIDPEEAAATAAKKAKKAKEEAEAQEKSHADLGDFLDAKRLKDRKDAQSKGKGDVKDSGLAEFTANGSLALSNGGIDSRSRMILQLLAQAKADAIKLDEFDLAKRIKACEGTVSKAAGQLSQLMTLKAEAIRAEDFDFAKEVKGKLDALQAATDDAVKDLHLSSLTEFFRSEFKAPPTMAEAKSARVMTTEENPIKSSSTSINQSTKSFKAPPKPAPAVNAEPHKLVQSRSESSLPDHQQSTPVFSPSRIPPAKPIQPSQPEEAPFSARLKTQSFMPAVAPPDSSPRNQELVERYAERKEQDDDSRDDVSFGSPAQSTHRSQKMTERSQRSDGDRALGGGGRYEVTKMMDAYPAPEGDESRSQPPTQRSEHSQPQQYLYEDAKQDQGYDQELEYEQEPEPSPQRHPLEGVPNYQDLPEPEPWVLEQQDQALQQGIVEVFGDYRARCIYSKVYAVREAVAHKAAMMLRGARGEIPPLRDCLSEVCALIRSLAGDKIHQVLVRVVQLVEDVLDVVPNTGLKRASIMPVLDPVLALFMDRLADGNHRIREVARIGVDAFVQCSAVGPLTVGIHTLRPLPKQTSGSLAWRPLVARQRLLRDLVDGFGLEAEVGLSLDTVMAFPKENACFSHSNGEVRDAARDLTVAVERRTGQAALTNYLKALRPKQLEDYRQAFDRMAREISRRDDGKQTNIGPFTSDAGNGAKTSPRTGPGKPGMPAPKNAAGHVATSAARAQARESFEENVQGAANSPGGKINCMFCGAGDRTWTEDTLDMHYWKDCPLLAPCPACAQVLEVAGLTDHLLDECEHKDSYLHCRTTGLAVRKQDYTTFQKGPYFRPLEDGTFLCPLCCTACMDTDADWNHHLCYDCTQNQRIYK